MLTVVSTAHQLEGLVDVATFHFDAGCWVEEPAGSGYIRPAIAGEVEVKLVYIRGWLADVTKERKNCDADGDVYFNGENYPPSDYRVEARHLVTGDIHGVTIRCSNDGTYQTLNEY